MIFLSEMEEELSRHIKISAEHFYGLTRNKCRALIMEYAVKNNVRVPPSWHQNGMTGVHFWISFKERNRLSIRTPEATSLGRATAFNLFTADKFYVNLNVKTFMMLMKHAALLFRNLETSLLLKE